MNENDRELLEGLRALAADGPREAPAHIEERLRTEFQRRNSRRKARGWVALLSVAAAVGIALLVWTHVGPVQSVASATEEDADAGFYPLPDAEGLPEVETAMVVRVQLPASSLELMGVPVGGEREDSSVQADLLLGEDGLARGVRLVE